MSDKLLPVLIFITIHAKSSYTLPNRDKNNIQNVNSESNLVWKNSLRSINNLNKLSHRKYEPNNFTSSLENGVKINNNNNNSHSESNGRSLKPRGFVSDLFNFVTGGFLYSFIEDERKNHEINASKKRRKHKNVKKPIYEHSSEEYDFDPIESFFDGLESMFYTRKRVKSESDADSNKVYELPKQPTQTESYENESTNNIEDTAYVSTELSQELISTEYPTTSNEQHEYSTSNENQSTDKTSMETSTFVAPTLQTVAVPLRRKTTTRSPQTIWLTSTSYTTVKKQKIKQPKITTTTSTTSRPIRKTKPPKIKKTTTRFTRTPTRRPQIKVKVTQRPLSKYYDNRYRIPNHNLQTKQNGIIYQVKDCNTTAPPQTWFSNIFSSDLWDDGKATKAPKPHSSLSSTTKAPGWLNIFDDDDGDDYAENQVQKPSTGSWFSEMFDDEADTTTPSSTTPITTPTTASTTETNWFNELVNAEQDDTENTQIEINPHKSKRGLKKSYGGYQLLRITSRSKKSVKKLLNMQEEIDNNGVTWWSLPSLKRPSDILVSPKMAQEVKDHLEENDLSYEVLIHDLQKAITFENPKLSKTHRLELEKQKGHPLTWQRYHRYADILRYMEHLSFKYPEIVSLLPIGRSSEGLPLMVAKVSLYEQNSSNTHEVHPNYDRWKLKQGTKPAVWIDAGMNAREWIAPAVATWFLHALVEGENDEGADLEILKFADWYILPVGNPDGYEYTHTSDRLWSKTRSKHPPNENALPSWLTWSWSNSQCVGVNPNRNWDYHWNEKGASKNPCDDFYAGPYAFSEPETKVVSTFLMENRDRLKLFLTLQSYSQMLLVPMTHSTMPFIDEVDVMEMGKLALRVLSDTSGIHYDLGTTANLLQPVSGTPYEWAKGMARIKYSYGVSVRDSQGPHGFLLPGSEIIPTAKELWEAIKVMAFNLN